MQIKRLKKDDIDLIKQCDKLLVNFFVEEKKYDSNLKLLDNYASMQKDLENNDVIMNVFTEEEKIIGFLYGYMEAGRRNLEKVGKLSFLYVEKEYRNKKIATRLMEKTINDLYASDAEIIELKSFIANKAANALYAKFGFLPIWQNLRKEKNINK